MLTKGVRIQLLVFAVLSVVAVTFASLQYIGLPKLFGFGQYTLSADFADTSGLYPRALVSYRGTDVGEVESLDLTDEGVFVRMKIDDGVQIPRNTRAEIHSTSAIGEQYIDFVPESSGAPYLGDGATIPRASTVELPQIAPVLDNLNALLASVPKSDLASLLKQLDIAFGGSGPDIQRLIDSASLLVRDAQDNLAPTTQLLADLKPFLSTQQRLGGETRSYVSDLASFTDQLRLSDADVRSLLDKGPPATTAVNRLVDTLTPTLPILLANLTAVSQVAYTYIPEIKTLLVLYPALIARIQEATLPHLDTSQVKLDLKLNNNNPPPCINGYIPVGDRRDPSDVSQLSTPDLLHCTLPADAAPAVRGARNDPCPNAPGRRATTPAGCGLHFSTGVSPKSMSTPSSTTIAAYEPVDGRFYAPNGKFFLLQATPSKGALKWQSLLTQPLKIR